ncbi:hypothetical protein Ae717Ps2_6621 [Pseudonocardia sp. Ae717_Ps2]|uniref:hypothetical protein n=1 Tax=Pseudonocardia sp. Ae717_Ps2 TaxID=1885573 RepID=UPI00095FA8A5|nr:hypothetical protein [Pseudonocardia sp. Ae717_Ps2]OLM28282.1 hypothetical protein Ae717Ps2_6621 [Pseudonocardia sp. Ae717_Ps2]
MSRERPALEWDVPDPTPQAGDVDARLREPSGRTTQLQVLVDHDSPGISQCPRCDWRATTTRRDCPSRVIAKALLDRSPLPAWVAHLSDEIPGARRRETAQTRDARRQADDELPGLFDAPARIPEQRR